MIDISTEHLESVKSILHKHVPSVSVWAFGSRVEGAAGKYSDLDLVIISKDEIPDETISALKEDFSESEIPFRVDVLDWSRISEEFRGAIKKNHEVVL